MKQSEETREPTASATAELVVRRSRFVATAIHVVSAAQAEDEVRRMRLEHPGASHIVYAYLVGDTRSEHAGMSDAGEPRGTAARPVMDILRGSGIRDLLITVERYFGGTKLGTGGLVHAYGDVTRRLIERLPTRPRVPRATLTCTLPYDLAERFRLELAAAGATIDEEAYGVEVRIVFSVTEEQTDELRRAVRDLSRGSVILKKSGS